MTRWIVIAFFVLSMGLGLLTACGKAGDPYRPSEIPTNADSNG